MDLDFCQKKLRINWDANLNGCVLKREIIVVEVSMHMHIAC